MSELTDLELVQRSLAGDGDAFHKLVERYEGPVYRVARRYLGNHHDSLEVSQEAFAKAFQKLATFDQSRRFSTWLYSVTANAARDILRFRGRRPVIYDDERLHRISGGESPECHASRQEEAERLRAAVDELDEEKRLAVVLRYFEGMSLKEVAEVTGERVSTLKVRLFRARREIMELMEER